MATVGVPPRIMGIGPAPATERLMAMHGLTIGDIDLIELAVGNQSRGAEIVATIPRPGA